MSVPVPKTSWRPSGLVLAAPLVAVLAFVLYPDPDVWGHLRFGLDLLRTHRVPLIDPYSFTQDRPWINHEWASELFMGAAYRFGGVTGLFLLKAALVAAMFSGLAYRFRGWSVLQQAGALLLVGWTGLPMLIQVRPQLWSFVATVVLLWLLSSGSVWWVPVLFGIWANFHGGLVVGLGLLAAWTVHEALRTRALRRPLAVSVLSVAATACTPYGYGLPRFLAETVRFGREIQDWQPLSQSAAILWPPAAILLAFLVWATWIRRLSWPLAGAAIGLLLASLQVRRLNLFAAIVALFWIAPAPAPAPATQRAGRWLDLIAIAIIFVAVWAVMRSQATCLRPDPGWAADFAATPFLDNERGTLALPFGWGEYAIWKWGPRLRVSIDARRETLYSEAHVFAQNRIADGDTSALDRLQPDIGWYPDRETAARAWFVGHGYHLAVDTGRSFVMTRGRPAGDSGIPVNPCFPN